MPIYEYECKKCGSRFEKRQGYHDKVEAACPKCRNEAQRLILPAPVIFKGKGFYVTDHRKPESDGNGKGKDSGKPEAATKPAAAGKSEVAAKSETTGKSGTKT